MEPIAAFFDAWGLTDPTVQATAIAAVYDETGTYADPRSDGILSGADAISAYVAMFAANAPGWTAKVVKSDTTADVTRVTVAFGGMGPDGTDMVQHGQYFGTLSDGKITALTGFVGTGAAE